MIKHGLAAAIVAAAFLLSGCGAAGARVSERVVDYGEVRLGPACNAQVRLFRAEQLAALLAEYVGAANMRAVSRSLELLREAVAAEVPEAVEVAARAYRATLALVIAEYLRERVPGLVVTGASDALELLEQYVEVRVDLAAIKIAVLIRCDVADKGVRDAS